MVVLPHEVVKLSTRLFCTFFTVDQLYQIYMCVLNMNQAISKYRNIRETDGLIKFCEDVFDSTDADTRISKPGARQKSWGSGNCFNAPSPFSYKVYTLCFVVRVENLLHFVNMLRALCAVLDPPLSTMLASDSRLKC